MLLRIKRTKTDKQIRCVQFWYCSLGNVYKKTTLRVCPHFRLELNFSNNSQNFLETFCVVSCAETKNNEHTFLNFLEEKIFKILKNRYFVEVDLKFLKIFLNFGRISLKNVSEQIQQKDPPLMN